MSTRKHPASHYLTPECQRLIAEFIGLALSTPKHIADIFVSYDGNCHIFSARSVVGGWFMEAINENATDLWIYFAHNTPEVNERQLRDGLDTLRHVIATAAKHGDGIAAKRAKELRESAERLVAEAAKLEGRA